ATGPRGFTSRALGIPESAFPDYPKTHTLFSHFINVPRCDQMETYNTSDSPPYPADDAALHHVFDGGWMWVLRFNNGITSAGFAVEDRLAEELGLREPEGAWERFLWRYPSIAAQFAGAERVQPFIHLPRVSYRAART